MFTHMRATNINYINIKHVKFIYFYDSNYLSEYGKFMGF